MRLPTPTIRRYLNKCYKCNKNDNDYWYICEMITTEETKFTLKMVFLIVIVKNSNFVNFLSKPIPLQFFSLNSSSYSLEE